jgi:hypothetical protein
MLGWTGLAWAGLEAPSRFQESTISWARGLKFNFYGVELSPNLPPGVLSSPQIYSIGPLATGNCLLHYLTNMTMCFCWHQ